MVKYMAFFGGIMENKFHYLIMLLTQTQISLSHSDSGLESGEEKELGELFKECNHYIELSDKNDRYLKISKALNEIISASYHNHFNFEKAFMEVDLNLLSKVTASFFDEMLKNTNYDNFKKKLDCCYNPVLACYFYQRYIEVNRLFDEVILKDFNVYMENLTEKTGKDYDTLFYDISDTESKELDLTVFDESWTYVLCYLMDKVHLEVGQATGFICHVCNSKSKYINKIINKFLYNTTDMYYSCQLYFLKEFHKDYKTQLDFSLDRVNLYLHVRNPKAAIKALNDDKYTLYDGGYSLETLLTTYTFPKDKLFVDQLAGILLSLQKAIRFSGHSGGFSPQDIYDIIYSDKIKVICKDSLEIIHDLFMNYIKDADGYFKFVEHIHEKNIKVYCDKEGIFLMDIVDTKNGRRLTDYQLDNYREAIQLLGGDNYEAIKNKVKIKKI